MAPTDGRRMPRRFHTPREAATGALKKKLAREGPVWGLVQGFRSDGISNSTER